MMATRGSIYLCARVNWIILDGPYHQGTWLLYNIMAYTTLTVVFILKIKPNVTGSKQFTDYLMAIPLPILTITVLTLLSMFPSAITVVSSLALVIIVFFIFFFPSGGKWKQYICIARMKGTDIMATRGSIYLSARVNWIIVDEPCHQGIRK